MREAICIACLCMIGCIATHEPPVAPTIVETPVATSVRVIVAPTEFPDLDTRFCETVVSDLRNAGFFSTILDCGASGKAELTALASWQPTRSPESWCTADNSIGLSLLTAGIVPACSCSSAYALDFSSTYSATHRVVLGREACTLFGWGPLFLNFKQEYHWRGPPDPSLRAAALRKQLVESSRDLKALVNQ